MAKSAKSLNLTARDLKIGANGEVTIANPKLMEKLKGELETMSPEDLEATTNYAACGNNYQCGKASELAEFEKSMGNLRK